ncbi:MAG: isoleucine--tRNA ligase [Coriobacteriaceae bacterium]|nr:isoleucine--tRNA ligase [Coriobacteriaceae bacterium]
MDYKSTMNLPATEFPMRANLAAREPEQLEFWDRIDIYRKSLEACAGGELFVLHDGPPYANGHIHMGTAFNKVFKDLVVKYKSMRGYLAPYVPGWDCHGQPIEHQVEKDLGPERMKETSQAELRRLCREYAMRFVGVQAEEFQRLGVRGDFDDPYLTLTPAYEAGNVRIFAEMYRRGMVYKGAKPIHWCVRCKTALAEAEIEYADETSDSIYVEFRFMVAPDAWADRGLPVSILIWTTTPWTLPANVAVTLSAGADHVGVKVGDRVVVLAEALVEQVAAAAGWEGHEVLAPRVKGGELAGLKYAQPIHEGVEGVIITGDHVDLSTGTGAVHTAPGHGEEDYLVGIQFGLPMPMPVDDDGVFDAGGGPFAGLHVWKANPVIVEWLGDKGVLAAAGKTSHSYPHCWRCKQPVIFRATEQWFVAMDRAAQGVRPLREGALAAIDTVDWIPGWSINRIRSMVADRPDWCISRQRAWGVPIPVHKCAKCGETVANAETFEAVARLFETEGADAWFTKAPSAYLPAGTACPRCGGTDLVPEGDIVDVWWESGVSHTSVLDARPELRRPAELYLEGSDQHRGWFQSALLTSVGAYDAAPYRAVLTHGFIVDGDGRKMSKSLGNVISPLDVVAKSGADIVRLWAASADYSQDVSVSDEILERTSEAYRRIRNTFRFLLSNLYDFEPSQAIAPADMPELDRYALARLAGLADDVTRFYDEWQFHRVHREIYDYCVTDLSAFYLDVLKDRLYSDAAGSPGRRSAQTVVAEVLQALVRLVAPILTFTSEEVWRFLPETMRGGAESVQLAGWPEVAAPGDAGMLLAVYADVLAVRDVVTKALEDARNAGAVGKSQEAAVRVAAPAKVAATLRERGAEALAEMFIVGSVEIIDGGDEVSVEVLSASGEKCPRCWNHRELSAEGVCERCAAVLAAL